jgi:hypothetical protein
MCNVVGLYWFIMNILLSISSTNLKRAAALRDEIVALETELLSLLGGSSVPSADAAAVPAKKSKMSPAARAKIAAAQRRRWAKVRRGNAAAKPAVNGSVKKRKMSPKVKARLSALAKARWARVKAAGKKAL